MDETPIKGSREMCVDGGGSRKDIDERAEVDEDPGGGSRSIESAREACV